MDAKVIVVTHKPYEMPTDSMYVPLAVGESRDLLRGSMQCDDEGDNISEKNATYCELTGLYWAWKNLSADYIGLAHYRRHFALGNAKGLQDVLSTNQLLSICNGNNVIVPPAKQYPFTTIRNHYINSLKGYQQIHTDDIRALGIAVTKTGASYEKAYSKVMEGKSAHMLNMFIMPEACYRDYCGWLFRVIDDVVAMRKDRPDQRRFAGALSEFLLDTYLAANGCDTVEVSLYEPEKPSTTSRIINAINRRVKGSGA